MFAPLFFVSFQLSFNNNAISCADVRTRQRPAHGVSGPGRGDRVVKISFWIRLSANRSPYRESGELVLGRVVFSHDMCGLV